MSVNREVRDPETDKFDLRRIGRASPSPPICRGGLASLGRLLLIDPPMPAVDDRFGKIGSCRTLPSGQSPRAPDRLGLVAPHSEEQPSSPGSEHSRNAARAATPDELAVCGRFDERRGTSPAGSACTTMAASSLECPTDQPSRLGRNAARRRGYRRRTGHYPAAPPSAGRLTPVAAMVRAANSRAGETTLERQVPSRTRHHAALTSQPRRAHAAALAAVGGHRPAGTRRCSRRGRHLTA